ncbi:MULTISPECIES: hypothetical protein [Gordonia]|uniref:Uncharacterized protein n=1 Tax=Gordonia terrae C-6 TaxID=1316928 RepID=R7Y911_9ACTN|nr:MULTISPECIES: hypothetical protein [Gordonia]EON32214.1 hypothetical protein GTC6_13661 [Gordonia terrae C-6]
MTTRTDLPPITRKLNSQLLGLAAGSSLDPETAAVIKDLGAHILSAVAELENDLIIAKAATSSPSPAAPSASALPANGRNGHQPQESTS